MTDRHQDRPQHASAANHRIEGLGDVHAGLGLSGGGIRFPRPLTIPDSLLAEDLAILKTAAALQA